MKILLLSNIFYPSLGGSETNAEILAREFTKFGHKVIIVTQTYGDDLDVDGLSFPFDVVRNPDWFKLIKLVNWCDVYFQNGITLKKAWPLLFIRKPWVIRHQGWIRTMDGSVNKFWGNPDSMLAKFKHWINQYTVSIAISESIAKHLKSPAVVIPNPYRDHLFRVIPDLAKTEDIVFLGRLVSEKGVDLLLEALANLQKSGLPPKLTIIGDGPDKELLQQKANELGVDQQVVFVGSKTGEELVRILNQHHIMVVPSRYDEPCGVVAIEGIACGCVVVGSEGGGLKDAIGFCGVTFPNGDVQALTKVLLNLLQNPEQLNIYRVNAPNHLLRHQKSTVAKAYLEVIEIAFNSGRYSQ